MKKYALIVLILLAMGQPLFAEQSPPPQEGWPREYTAAEGTVVLYQPQIKTWADYARLDGLAAVKVTPAGAKTEYFGAAQMVAETSTDFDSRMVVLRNTRITDITFPNIEAKLATRCSDIVKQAITPRDNIPMALDRIIAEVEQTQKHSQGVAVNLDPPPIFRSEKPAILAIFMGEPRFEPVSSAGLLFAVNTNWDILLDSKTGTYYLRNEKSWLQTTDVLKGPWSAAQQLPQEMHRLPQDDNWAETRKHIPGQQAASVPVVFASQDPAELILSDGPPSFSPITGTPLLYAANTESDLFLHSREANFYFLVAGRWFRARSLDGPWKAASKDLPADFAKIPPDHAKAEVLASVPGTPEAEAALMLAAIPRKATVDRKETTVTVVYEGTPQFEVIEGTQTVYYAINTPYSVFRVSNGYYTCHEGVWFQSTAATGPWAVSISVPTVIYTIPATHPLYNVTYVKVYSSTPSTVVVGYSAGYTGAYVAATGVLMFGVGLAIAHHHHHHWHYRHYRYHPHYYSYGVSARYSYHRGGYYRGARYYGPYGGAGRYAGYNPATRTYTRGAYRYGPSGSAYARSAYNPYTGRSGAQARANTPYGSWGRTVVSDGKNWAQGGHRANWRGSVAGAETSRGGAAVAGRSNITGNQGGVARNRHGDVYAGRNGNVYKRDQGGSWQKRSGNEWRNTSRNPSALQQQYRARSNGQQRVQQQRSYSGGGGRGGGGRGGGRIRR